MELAAQCMHCVFPSWHYTTSTHYCEVQLEVPVLSMTSIGVNIKFSVMQHRRYSHLEKLTELTVLVD